MTARLDPVIRVYREHYPGVAYRVVDVGSRDGEDCATLVAALGGVGVCVEARPDHAASIRSRFPQFTVIEAAASDTVGSAEFLCIDGDLGLAGSSSLNLGRQLTYKGRKRVITVPTVRLEEELPAGRLDVLKVDVEGFTLQALHGLGTRIDDVRVAHLETETVERAHWREPANNRAVAVFMRGHGFTLAGVDYEWGPSIEDQTWVRATRHVEEPEIL